VLACLKSVRAQLPDVPLLFTFRTFAEGGACEMAPADYFDLLHAAAASGDADLIDIELFAGDEGVQAAIAAAKAHGVAVVTSAGWPGPPCGCASNCPTPTWRPWMFTRALRKVNMSGF